MEAASREAGALAGKALWALVDTVLVVRPISRSLVPPGTALSGRLGLKPARVRVSGSGGETPQHRVNQAAGMLTPGKLAGQGFRYSARAAQVAR